MRILLRSIVPAALGLCLVAGCKAKTENPDVPAVAEGESMHSEVHAAAAKSLIGDWLIDSKGAIDLEGMDPDEAAFLEALANTMQAAARFQEDGTALMVARVGDAPSQVQPGTWSVKSADLSSFTISMRGQGQPTPEEIVMTPQADGSMRMLSGDATLLLVRGNIDALLAAKDAPVPVPDEDADAGAPTEDVPAPEGAVAE